jgi:hypothetical protein
MFPVVGLLSAVCAALGLYGIYWYENLSKEEKKEADKLATQYASRLYNKGLNQLTAQQMSRVNELVKDHFGR